MISTTTGRIGGPTGRRGAASAIEHRTARLRPRGSLAVSGWYAAGHGRGRRTKPILWYRSCCLGGNMSETVERAERAADFADRRARDADRISRWMIGIALALAGILIAGQITLNVQVNGLVSQVSEIRAAMLD